MRHGEITPSDSSSYNLFTQQRHFFIRRLHYFISYSTTREITPPVLCHVMCSLKFSETWGDNSIRFFIISCSKLKIIFFYEYTIYYFLYSTYIIFIFYGFMLTLCVKFSTKKICLMIMKMLKYL